MKSALIVCILALALVAGVYCTCLVCPQPLQNDPNPQFCGYNKFGYFNVTYSQFTSFNCNHPNQPLVKAYDQRCPPSKPTNCPVRNCPQNGTSVCGQLNGVGGYTVAEFQNQCQLDNFNCFNPDAAHFLVNPIWCKSFGW